MRTSIVLLSSFLCFSVFSHAQCTYSRNFLDVSFLGNESYSLNGVNGFSNSNGVSVRYGKAKSSGFSYAFGVTSRNTLMRSSSLYVQKNRQSLSFELKRDLLSIGRLSITPLASVSVGRMQLSGNWDSDFFGAPQYSAAMLGGETGLELNCSLLCFLDVFGRSTVAFEKGLKNFIHSSITYVHARPVGELGLRLSI